MHAIGRQPQRAPDGAPVHYERRRTQQTTLYRLCSNAYGRGLQVGAETRALEGVRQSLPCPWPGAPPPVQLQLAASSTSPLPK